MAVKGLEHWIHKFTNQGMPVAGRVINEINKLTGDSETQLNQLTEVILRDPNLTSHVLRVANSACYNYNKSPVSTVSRAIVLIGLKGTRALCISLLLIDSMLGKEGRERLLQVMAMSFHAATQARALVGGAGDSIEEEAFIAALLFNLGEMAFWTIESPSESKKKLYDKDKSVRREAMEEILGTSFKCITRALSKQWRLGDTLDVALNPGKSPERKIVAVLLADKVSRLAQDGWTHEAMKKTIEEIAKFTGKTSAEALLMMKETADEAGSVARQYGAGPVCEFIPSANKSSVDQDRGTPSQPPKILKGDPHLQLSILRELTKTASERVDVNTIFHMVIEGMHRGVGLERVCIAFAKNHRLTAMYALGHNTKEWKTKFDFDIGPYTDNIFTEVLGDKNDCTWMDQDFVEQNKHLYSSEITRVLGNLPGLCHVLEVNGKRLALFYADRGDLGGELTQDQFESFHHFARQAQITLTQSTHTSPVRNAKVG